MWPDHVCTQIEVVTWFPVLGIIPKDPNTAQDIADTLRGKHPQLQVWVKVRRNAGCRTMLVIHSTGYCRSE